MSRHRTIKALYLADELGDYDGGEDYDDEPRTDSEVTPARLSILQMLEGTIKVREVVGSDVPGITDKAIRESLWHYYYDVEKTVTWLLGKIAKISIFYYPDDLISTDRHSAAKKEHKPNPNNQHAKFFDDCPWLKVPFHRRADIRPEPLYPPGGLLGGSSKQEAKLSKIAALAASRRKERETRNSSILISKESTLALTLSKQLTYTSGINAGDIKSSSVGSSVKQTASPAIDISQNPSFPEQKSLENPSYCLSHHERLWSQLECLPNRQDIVASPSHFARTIMGHGTEQHNPTRLSGGSLFNVALKDNWYIAESTDFTGPSPDDLVMVAQNPKGLKAPKKPTKPIDGDQISIPVLNGRSVPSADLPRVKSRNLDVLTEFKNSKSKNSANFIVIGHVDAGKSTLMGRLLLDLGVVDQRTVEKFRREAESIGKSSFALAWVLDQTSEERNRGVTIDIATNNFETKNTKFTILDAPGHRDFVPNMIAGASQADFALLVIDASTGSFESGLKGQTKEHALLVRSMGVQRMIIAINKLDTVEWSEDRYKEIEQQTSAFLAATGFQMKNVSFVPCAGLTGSNVVKRNEDVPLWYKGPTLIQSLESSEPITRALQKPLRITINDIFRGGAQNALSISGRLDAGSVQVGDAVLAMPSGETACIKGIQVDQEPKDWAIAGQNTVLNLSDIDSIHIKTGDVLCSISSPIENLTSFSLKILAFEHVMPMHIDLHRGRLHVPGKIAQLATILDKSNGSVLKKRPRIIQPGSVAQIRVELDQGVPLEAAAKVVLRSNGETIAAGLIE
ncbi:MAG: Hsp70 suppressor, GTPase facilitates ribosomal subunit dissociation [Trizodia sp. TS-e1964]|nr:MAG: Hsp70 suppressor, GTPase facilitates ribosomal subunit dissociation [Trizodia sp. TS-e1964]